MTCPRSDKRSSMHPARTWRHVLASANRMPCDPEIGYESSAVRKGGRPSVKLEGGSSGEVPVKVGHGQPGVRKTADRRDGRRGTSLGGGGLAHSPCLTSDPRPHRPDGREVPRPQHRRTLSVQRGRGLGWRFRDDLTSQMSLIVAGSSMSSSAPSRRDRDISLASVTAHVGCRPARLQGGRRGGAGQWYVVCGHRPRRRDRRPTRGR